MIKTNLRKSRQKTCMSATGVEVSSPLTLMEKSKVSSLKAFNDIYIIEEDPIELMVDSDSGLTPEVMTALKESKLIIPDAYKDFAEKFPCRGKILSYGEGTKYPKAGLLKEGDRVVYARFGVQRYKYEGRTLCDVREQDLHALID